MTAAVCLKCGAMKVGAWTSCPECRHVPETEEEKAKAVLASDQNLSPGDLKAVSMTVKEGRQINFVPEQIESLAAGIKQFENDPEEKRRFQRFKLKLGLGCLTVVLLIIGLIVWLSR